MMRYVIVDTIKKSLQIMGKKKTSSVNRVNIGLRSNIVRG